MSDTPRRPTDPKIGPADPATRRRMMEQHMREAAAENRRKRPIDYDDNDRDHLPQTGRNPDAHRELRRGPQGKTIMESVDDAQ